jgi:hypothetical protein
MMTANGIREIQGEADLQQSERLHSHPCGLVRSGRSQEEIVTRIAKPSFGVDDVARYRHDYFPQLTAALLPKGVLPAKRRW